MDDDLSEDFDSQQEQEDDYGDEAGDEDEYAEDDESWRNDPVNFPHPFGQYIDDRVDQARTTTEMRMQHLSYALRSKPSWWKKYKDPEIRATWKREATEQEIMGHKLTEAEIDYVLNELAGYDEIRDDETGIQQSCFARIYESDALVPEDLLRKLKSAVSILDDVPETDNNWRPRANGVVLDLIDPSLYCLVYDRTLGFSRTDSQASLELKPIDEFTAPGDEWASSLLYAWISTDFRLSKEGGPAKALAYINNVHPSNTELYNVIEDLVSRFVPMFNRVLADLKEMPLPQRIRHWVTFEFGTPELEPGEDLVHYESRLVEWRKTRVYTLPTISDTYSKHVWGGFDPYKLEGRTVQIVVRLSNCYLTPEKPSYAGELWHTEGMANESIIACGVYYYDSENIEENRLAFRNAVSLWDIPYDHWDPIETKHAYGLDSTTGFNQHLGSVGAISGRCIAFPNVYQQQVSPFSLIDKTKPGHCKTLSLFLVDPTRRVLSTTDIPPQQAEWTLQAMGSAGEASLFSTLPAELRDMIASGAGAMTLTEAKKIREGLMDERAKLVETQNEHFFETEFDVYVHEH